MKNECLHPHFYLLESIESDKETINYCNCLVCGQNLFVKESDIPKENILIPNRYNFHGKTHLRPKLSTVIEKYQSRFQFYFDKNPKMALENIKVLAIIKEQNDVYENIYNQESKDLEAACKSLKLLKK